MWVKTQWGTQTVISFPKESLSASVTKAAVVVRVHKQGSQLQDSVSSSFDK
jgi:hypothetical protein